jgi:PKD repeat protein
MEIQDDGKIIIAGCTGGLQPADNDWALWRFNADGSIDNTFGTNGLTTTEFFNGTEEALGLALYENKIIVAGKTRNATDWLDFGVAKYWNGISALFTTGNTTLCSGGSVQFTDQSSGSPNSWSWTFEGGTPATSTLQNPLVTYSTPGVYDVTLTITKGAQTNTLVKTDLIHVEAPVTTAPAQPTGPTAICGSFTFDYTSVTVPNATAYTWMVDPVTAGTISGTGITGTLNASNTWNGPFTVKITGSNSCGTGPSSPALNVVSTHQPLVYSLFSGGGYCAGQSGYEIKLEDSETGVDYQLYKDGVASGSALPGTGNMLSFGPQTTGNYTVTGINGSCSADMQGISTNYIIDLPSAAAQPTGPSTTCNNVSSTFTGVLPANGFTLAWTIDPPTAGTITQPTLTSALVTWALGFSGSVAVIVQGQNECGKGPSSPIHAITVNPLPAPVASGITSVCKTQEITYSTASVAGTTYSWAVTGGSISSGQGSNLVTVIWGNPGTGTVLVTETLPTGCTGSSQILTITISECTGMADQQAESISIYPNPASDILNIEIGSQIRGSVKISICNHLGQIVYNSSEIILTGCNPLKVDISNLTPGTYSLQLSNENDICKKVFIKCR